MRLVRIVLLLPLLFLSCSGGVPHRGVVAQVGKYRLCKSDLVTLFNKDMTSEDSMAVLRSYVDNWVADKARLLEAEKSLDKSDYNITKEIEEYRTSLLLYRYEELYLKRNLDTAVTYEELEDYYRKHREIYKSTESVVRARYILMDTENPNIGRVASLYKTDIPEKCLELERICYSSAYEYTDFGMEWIGLSRLASIIGISPSDAESIFNRTSHYRFTDGAYSHFVYIMEMIPPGFGLPFDYVKEDVRRGVLNRRSSEILKRMEYEALRKAYHDNEIKIYIDEKGN